MGINYTKGNLSYSEKQQIKKEVEVLKQKYPNNIPIVVICKDKLELAKNKYLVGGDLTLGQFLFIVRKKLKNDINSSKAIYFFVNGVIPPSSSTMLEIYEAHKDSECNMLFITICAENTFG
jgi:GABA(A) receptor-associated protein